MPLGDYQIKDAADRDCWDLLGFGAETLGKRHDAGLDVCEHEGETAAVFRVAGTNVYYQLVDSAFGNGLRINAVWREVDDCPYGEDC
jgi:hypothetical protein